MTDGNDIPSGRRPMTDPGADAAGVGPRPRRHWIVYRPAGGRWIIPVVVREESDADAAREAGLKVEGPFVLAFEDT